MADHGVELAVNIGADMESSLRSVRLAEEHASIYAVVGVHPSSTGQMKDSELEELRRLARHLLTLKKEHLENLILFAKGIKLLGVDYMNFTAFDTKKIDEYAKQAKESWGNTKEFKEFEKKQKNRSDEETKMVNQQLMMVFAEFGKIKSEKYESEEAQNLVKKLQNFITDNFYNCSNEILSGLGKMYASGGDFTKNIDEFAGEGTAVFVDKAIEYYCK